MSIVRALGWNKGVELEHKTERIQNGVSVCFTDSRVEWRLHCFTLLVFTPEFVEHRFHLNSCFSTFPGDAACGCPASACCGIVSSPDPCPLSEKSHCSDALSQWTVHAVCSQALPLCDIFGDLPAISGGNKRGLNTGQYSVNWSQVYLGQV